MERKSDEKMDFAALRHRYQKTLTPGQRAELRRVRWPDDLRFIPALYRLLAGRRPGPQTLRVAFCLPYANHREGVESLGAQLVKANVSDKRLFQIMRSQSPNDLAYLRRILQQTEPTVDWNQLGNRLFYWGENSKRAIVEEYFMEQYSEKSPKRSNA